MKIFLTGANGVVGGSIASFFLKKKFKITIISTDKKKILKKYKNYKELIKVYTYNELKLVNKEDISYESYFIHAAGITSLIFNSLSKFNKINLNSTRKVLKFCTKNKVKNFYLISSLSIFKLNNINKIYKHSIKRPSSNYGKSKLAQEKLVKNICKNNNINYKIIRMPSIYGEFTKGKIKFLRILVNMYFPLPIIGINAHRSYLDINLLPKKIFKLIQSNVKSDEIFISDIEDYTLEQLINKINFKKKKIIKFNLIRFIPKFLLKRILEFNSIKKLIIEKSQKF